MDRLKPKTNPLLYAAIGTSTLAVFWADLLSALGIVVWVFYVVPLGLSVLTWRPRAPVLAGLGITTLLVTGMLLSPSGSRALVWQINRSFGLIMVWGMAMLARQLIVNRQAVALREWVKSGQTGLSSRLLGEQDVDRLSEVVLRYLSEYLGAPVAALYTRTADRSLRLAGSYALDRAAKAREAVQWGEGLVGQAAKDGRVLVVSDGPLGDLPVSSAWGSRAPLQLVLSPIRAEGEVRAVLELGFLQTVEAPTLELLETLSESIGVALRSAEYRTRLEQLLAQTQQQAEELQTQQEELRVTNEELEEQSRSLRESQARLEGQQAELEQTNTQLEEQSQVLEAQRNELASSKEAITRKAVELTRANRYKSEFLANMSHELRTPLNSSLILSKLLADNRSGNLSEEEVRFAETIHGANRDLLNLINDVLDLARIEAGKIQLTLEEVALAATAESLARTFEPLATEKGLTFTLEVAEGLPQVLTTDGTRLQQVLRNLLSNGLKFTDRGTVTLRIEAAGEDRIAFSVVDTGTGIPPDRLEVIFEAFRQADGSTHRKYGGSGLGLSIARDLARRLGGEIQVQSVVGAGSTFTLLLPREAPRAESLAPPKEGVGALSPPPRPAPEPSPAAPAPAPRGLVPDDRGSLTPGSRRILVVEDDQRFARIVYDLAREQGFECLVATSADEGIELARRYLPSAIALDVNLPDQSGLSVLHQLKQTSATRHIPVHMVSVADHTQQALEMGAVGYAIKPVGRDELEEAFKRLQTRLEQKLRRVLVVEDDRAQRESICALLADADVELTALATAGEALEHLGRVSFDCMVMDLGLPDMSGYDLLEKMSADESFSFPPVIVYTGRSLSPEQEERLGRYSRSIVIKGARSPERLLDEVTLFLHRVEANLPRAQQRMIQEARSREAVFEGRRILLAEDDVRNVFALTSVLEPRGALVEIARNGAKALEALGRAAGDGGVDLVLMDIMMPEMDGLTAIREIRRRAEWQKLPIIALTAKAMPEDRQRCLEAGANDYIAKPLDVDKLLSLMRVWMPKP